jgi:hypothetical protein
MRQVLTVLVVFTLSSLAKAARADEFVEKFERLVDPVPSDISADFVDPTVRTQFHLVTRYAPAPREAVWSWELSSNIRLADHFALSFALPFGLDFPHTSVEMRPNQFFFGDARVGFLGGVAIKLAPHWKETGPPTLTLGGQLDYYIPTRPKFDNGDPRCAASGFYALCYPTLLTMNIHPLEPGLWLAGATAFRLRGHVGFAFYRFQVEGELGLTPAFTLESSSSTYVWLTYGVRLRAFPLRELEPYVEIGGVSTVSAPTLDAFPQGPPQLSPGIRVHAFGFDPAVFVSIPLGDHSIAKVVIGIDLAGAQEHYFAEKERELGDPLNF